VARRADLSLPSLEPAPTAPARAADLLRAAIFEGRFAPGTPLPEVTLAASLNVSRSTVREALRSLVGERLLTFETHKGAAVRALTETDVRDLYAGRRLVELSAIDSAAARDLPPDAFAAPLAEADAAVDAGDWLTVGTADLRFHAEIVALHGSPRVTAFFQRLTTELRLGFLAIPVPEFHRPYLIRNHALADLMRAGDLVAARAELAAYLDDAADQVAAAVRGA
jgi:DNA-binding GntR family transcriptional regulator